MTSKNKTYQPEFKREAILLAKDPNNTVAGVARDLGLHPNLLHRWIRQAKGREASGRPAFTGRGVHALNEHEQEIQRLKRELEIARQERDILKKAVACLDHKTHLTGMVASSPGKVAEIQIHQPTP